MFERDAMVKLLVDSGTTSLRSIHGQGNYITSIDYQSINWLIFSSIQPEVPSAFIWKGSNTPNNLNIIRAQNNIRIIMLADYTA